MEDLVKIIECPRDAWQGLPAQIPSETKAAYLRDLIDAGFTHIDAVSFVSPAAVPQMADSERVLEMLNPPEDVEIIGIVVNRKGAERAIRTGSVSTLGFPYSISAEFLRRNQHQTPQESLHELEAVQRARCKTRDWTWSPISPWPSEILTAMHGASEPSSRDANNSSRSACAPSPSPIRWGSHRPSKSPIQLLRCSRCVMASNWESIFMQGGTKLLSAIRAAYDAGCRRFDAAIGGLGGCPFAQDALVGNLPTETLIAVLTECGASLPKLGPLNGLLRRSAEIAANCGTPA